MTAPSEPSVLGFSISGDDEHSRMHLHLDPGRKAGVFARRLAERARAEHHRAKMTGVKGRPLEALWIEFCRTESGALAEEPTGGFLNLLSKWENAEIYHAADITGPGSPGGDIDHLVVFPAINFALTIETKYRFHEHELTKYLREAHAQAAAVTAITGWWTLPVLVQALSAVKDIRRKGDPAPGAPRRETNGKPDKELSPGWIDQGRALWCEAQDLAAMISRLVLDNDGLRTGPYVCCPFPREPHPRFVAQCSGPCHQASVPASCSAETTSAAPPAASGSQQRHGISRPVEPDATRQAVRVPISRLEATLLASRSRLAA